MPGIADKFTQAAPRRLLEHDEFRLKWRDHFPPSLAPPLVALLVYWRVREMIQAPRGRLNFYLRKTSPFSTPILELPGFELPRRQRLYPPLHPPIRRPVTEARSFLDLGLDGVPDHPPPDLAGRLADHIDEFRLIGHCSILAKCLAQADPVCAQHLNDLLRDCLELRQR
jgi:hypothetical protein